MVSRCGTDIYVLLGLILEKTVVALNLPENESYELTDRIKGVILNSFGNCGLVIYINGYLMNSLGSGIITAV